MSAFISVIIATYNRGASLRETLACLAGQEGDGSFDYEVIVVDNNSTDGTRLVVEDFCAQFPARFVYLFEPRQGKAKALNSATRHSRGSILAFTDDDVRVDSNWLREVSKCFRETGCDGMGGRILPTYPPEAPAWIKKDPRQMAGVVFVFDFGDKTLPFDKAMDRFLGGNFAFRKDVIEACGGFREDLGPGQGIAGEDAELCYRMINKGKKLYYCGPAIVWHPTDLKRLDLKCMARWNMTLGRFAGRMEYETKGSELIFWGAAPRYLYRGIVVDGLKLLVLVFNRRFFFNALRAFFRKVGMIQEYRGLRRSGKL